MRRGLSLLVAAGFVAASLLACDLSLILSHYGFSGYDVSPMVDAGYRVFLGQVPGRDFIVTFPASLYLLVAASFRVFGVTWKAIALGECCLYLAMVLLGLRLMALLARTGDRRSALGLFATFWAGQTILLVSINYPWHAAMAQAFGLYAAMATLVLCRAAAGARATRMEAIVHVAVGCALLLLSKPNTAFLALALCLFACWRAGLSRAALFAIAALGLAGSAACLAPEHVTPWGMLGAYVGLTGRLIPRALLHDILPPFYARYGLGSLLVYAILAPAWTMAAISAWRSRQRWSQDPAMLLGCGCIVVSLVGMGTNFDYKLTDAPLSLFGLAILALSVVPALRFRVLCATAALLGVAAYFGATRFRMQAVGTWADDKCPTRVWFADDFFERFKACKEVPDALLQVDHALGTTPHQRVFFGPALEFLYARERLPEPLHLPDWWDPGSSYAKSRTDEISRSWHDDRFDLLIFDKGEDRAQMPLAIDLEINERYTELPGFDLVHVYVPRVQQDAP